MKALARIISIIFHPLLFPTYGALLILATNPHLFGPFGDRTQGAWLIIVFALTFMFPAVWLLMMKGLKMIDNLELRSSQERIVPFVATATFYLWATWMFKPGMHMKIPPNVLIFYMMIGSSLAVFLAFFLNIFLKISLHSLGVGSLLGLLLTLVRYSGYDLRGILIIVILIAGLTGTARLLLKAHTRSEVSIGYLAGFTTQFIAFSIVPHFF